jgi:hypothetical protein
MYLFVGYGNALKKNDEDGVTKQQLSQKKSWKRKAWMWPVGIGGGAVLWTMCDFLLLTGCNTSAPLSPIMYLVAIIDKLIFIITKRDLAWSKTYIMIAFSDGTSIKIDQSKLKTDENQRYFYYDIVGNQHFCNIKPGTETKKWNLTNDNYRWRLKMEYWIIANLIIGAAIGAYLVSKLTKADIQETDDTINDASQSSATHSSS